MFNREGKTTVTCIKEPVIVLSLVASEKMKEYIKGMGSTEIGWMGFMSKLEDEEVYIVDDVFVPFQDVNGGTCEIREVESNEAMRQLYLADEDKYNSIRLWGHSHHTMPVTPSPQDNTQFQKFVDRWQDEQVNPYFVRLIANSKGVIKCDLYDNVTKLRYENVEVLTERPFVQSFYEDIAKEIAENTRAKVYEAPKSTGKQNGVVTVVKNGITVVQNTNDQSFMEEYLESVKHWNDDYSSPRVMLPPEKLQIVSNLTGNSAECVLAFTGHDSIGSQATLSFVKHGMKLSEIFIGSKETAADLATKYKAMLFNLADGIGRELAIDLQQVVYDTIQYAEEDGREEFDNLKTAAEKSDWAIDYTSLGIKNMLGDCLIEMGYSADEVNEILCTQFMKFIRAITLFEAIYENAETLQLLGLTKSAVSSTLFEHSKVNRFPLTSEGIYNLVTACTSEFTSKKKQQSKKNNSGQGRLTV